MAEKETVVESKGNCLGTKIGAMTFFLLEKQRQTIQKKLWILLHQPTNYITESNTARLSNPESKECLLERYKRVKRRTNAFERYRK